LIDIAGHQLGRATTAADGRYVLHAAGSGTYVLIGSAGSRRPQAVTVLVGDAPVDHDLVLTGAIGLTGQVRQAPGGNPLAGALVVATDIRGEVVASGKAADDGAFAFADLVPGSYTLAVSAGGHRPTAAPVEVVSGGPNRYEVLLYPAAVINGTVRNRGGAPVDDARVTLLDGVGNVVGTAMTGPDGGYGFTDLEGGAYTVIAGGYAPVAVSVYLDGKGEDGFDVDLSHAG
jgi:hypothetical protein